MKIANASVAGVATTLLAALSASSAQAASYNLNGTLLNAGFESGLTSWSYSGDQVNSNTYLTTAEWAAQTWSSSSPYYTDAQLAAMYPGKPWGANPDITHIDQTPAGGDVTTIVAAAVGSGFVGSRQNGYAGHCSIGGSLPPCDTPTSFYDTNFQIYQTIVGSFTTTDTFDITIWANRGRLDPGSTLNTSSTVTARICSQVNLTQPCSSGTLLTFTNWTTNGQWASQTFTGITLPSVAASGDIRIQITGQNSDHDRYVAIDLAGPVPVPAAVWMFGSALGVLGWIRRARR